VYPRGGHVPEDHHGIDGAPAQLLGDRVGAGGAPGAAARGNERDRAADVRRRQHAAELDERGGARQLGLGPALGRVAMGDDDDLRGRDPGAAGDDVHQRAVAVDRLALQPRQPDVERPRAAGKPGVAQARRHALGQRLVGGVAGAPVRERPRHVAEIPERPLRLECVGCQGAAQRSRKILERERGEDQREEDRCQRGTVEARVQHSFS
jgi:hypothetical protein